VHQSFRRGQIVDGDNVNVCVAAFQKRAQHAAADPAKSVDCDFQGHGFCLRLAGVA
jgi:hypothetical protein